jgi:hypothetical protein
MSDMSAMTRNSYLIDTKIYQSILRSCRFFADTTNLKITYITGIAGRHTHKITVRHILALKRILRYLAGTTNTGLHYPRKSPTFCSLL